MTDYYAIEPEVAGGWGERTVSDVSVHPPLVTRLHYEFEGWLGDVLLESFPCFIVTELARDSINRLDPTGANFGDVEVTTSEEFEELHPNTVLPRFHWLQIRGKAGQADFGLTHDSRLVVSERILRALRSLGLSHAIVSEFDKTKES